MSNKTFVYLIILSIVMISFSQDFPIEIIKNDFVITINSTDSTNFPIYYSDQSVRDSISNNFGNSHKRASAIEDYLLKKTNPGIEIKENEILITLINENKILLELNDNTMEAGYNFESYFKELEFLLFRVQWYEGNDYLLMNRKNGNRTKMFGKPYFSPSKKYFISINNDVEAGYSYNGFQLFEFKNEDFKLLWQYEPQEWGPVDIKWIDENNLAVKNYTLVVEKNKLVDKFFYSKLNFIKKK